MKKIITFIAAVAMIAVSCQKENTPADKDSNSQVEGKLTATIVKTKVSYTETASMDLQPAWEIGDKIIGFDDAGNTYTLTVASVSAETATLNGTVPDGALHLIYKSGAQASDISAKSLAVDYTAQKGDKTMPAVMLADGTVTGGACNFAFTNAGAIIGISAVKGVPSGAAISKITVEGENLSAATVALSGSALALTATTNTSDTISTATLSGITTTDANGTLSSPVFIAVPAGAAIDQVSVFVPKEAETMKVPSTAADKEGVDYVTIGGVKWAKWNVGASSQADYGWYFAWAGTEGYMRYTEYENTWQSATATSVKYSYYLSSTHTAAASDYLYVNTQSFELSDHRFDPYRCPYHSGPSYANGYTKYIPSDKSTQWSGEGSPDNKTILDQEDDAAHVNWGGTWRMPTIAELVAMVDATYWAWDATDKGYYVYAPNPSTDAGKKNGEGTGTYVKSNALLFFPATGFGSNNERSMIKSGYFWTKSIKEDQPEYGRALVIYDSVVGITGGMYRRYGCTVRPVSD